MCVCMCVCSSFFISAINALSRCVVFQQCTYLDVLSLGRGLVCVQMCSSFFFCHKCIVKMCRLSAVNLSRCVVFRQCICQDVVFWQCICQDVSSFGSASVKMSSFGSAFVKMCRLSAMHLSRRVVFGQGALCVCMCVFFLFILHKCIVKMCCLSAVHLSRCAVFRQCMCQDLSSFGNAPVKMCHLWAGGLVCVHVCLLHYLCPKCIVKMCRQQCTCQDVMSLGRGPCVCVHVCVFPFYFCHKCIVKMCRLSAMHLSRCVVFGQGPCVCADVFFLFISAINALSRCAVFRQ